MSLSLSIFMQEKKWNDILETAADISVKLTKAKSAILDLYELACSVAEVEVVDYYDTLKQLEEVCWSHKKTTKKTDEASHSYQHQILFPVVSSLDQDIHVGPKGHTETSQEKKSRK